MLVTFENIIEPNIAHEIMSQYCVKYFKSEYKQLYTNINNNILPWIYYSVDITILDLDAISTVGIDPDTCVYSHDERQKKLFSTTCRRAYDLITSLEPWKEVDLELFDGSMGWTVAITHE